VFEGHIKLFRRLKKSPYYHDSQYVHLWIHLLMSVNWSEKRLKLDKSDRFVDLHSGQVLTSRDKLSEQTGIHRSKIDRILKAFQSEQQIEQQTFSKYRVISILNWQQYQCGEQETEPQMSNKRATDEQQMSTNKKVKKEKKDKEESKDLSPSDDGAQAEDFISRKKRVLAGKRRDTFKAFWSAFDYKKGRAEAIDAWLDIPQLTDTLVGKIVAAAKREATGRPDAIAQGRTPKMAQGWISGRRWEDESEATPQGQAGTDKQQEYYRSLGYDIP
jgi:hypothetical protein